MADNHLTMRHFFIVIFWFAVTLQGCCRAVSTTVQTVADSVFTQSTTVEQAHHATDSSAHIESVAAGGFVVESVSQTTELYDTAGRLTARTTTTINRHTETNYNSTSQTVEVAATDDTLLMADTTSHKKLTVSTENFQKEPIKRVRPLRICYWFLIVLGLIAVIGYYRYKQFCNHDYWQ